MYRLTSTPNVVVRIADGAVITVGELATEDSAAYQAWLAGGGVPEAAPVPPAPTQHDLDFNRYVRRAAARDRLLAEMAADNMARVRSGAWTVSDLQGLMADPQTKVVIDLINTLSFELAAQALAASPNVLLTPEIKAGWVAKLQAHFYLVP